MSAIPMKTKSRFATAHIAKSIYVEIDEEAMIDFLRENGYTVTGTQDATDPTTFEYRIWTAMKIGRADEVKRLLAEMLYERIGVVV